MKRLLAVVLILVNILTGKAQELETVLLAIEDANPLLQNYFNPAMKGMMNSMNGGWATTAKVHKTLGFDITIGVNASFVPQKDRAFRFVPEDYNYLSVPSGQTQLPTLMSDKDADARIYISVPTGDGLYRVASITMPGGIANKLPANAVPAPTVQLGLGLPLKTDIKVRFVPKLNYHDDLDASLFGLGLQHDILQYFQPLDKLPLSVSLLGAFTNMTIGYDIIDEDANDNVEVRNGGLDFKMNTWTVQALASLDFKIITLYGGVGYNNGKTTIRMKGDYQLTYDVEDAHGNRIGSAQESISNPINLNFEANGIRGAIGARLNLGFFKIFADYTLQEYNTATMGIAFSVR